MIKGANYGWPLCEGKCENSSFVDPVYVYPHPSGCATTGGVFYRGVQFPEEHQGSYFFGDLCAPWIKTLPADYEVADFAVNTAGGIVDLEVGPDGSLYYLSFVNGAVYRIQFGDGGNQPPIAVAQVSPTAGVAPLEVSFDARQSVDPDGDSLTFHWDFGDGSPITAGEPPAMFTVPTAPMSSK